MLCRRRLGDNAFTGLLERVGSYLTPAPAIGAAGQSGPITGPVSLAATTGVLLPGIHDRLIGWALSLRMAATARVRMAALLSGPGEVVAAAIVGR